MSLTPTSPLIADWVEHDLEWRYFWNPIIRPITIPANGQIQIPSQGYTFTAPEGTLISFSAVFQHPACGWRIESDPEFDTRDTFTVNNTYLLGTLNQPWGVFATVPPPDASRLLWSNIIQRNSMEKLDEAIPSKYR